MQVDIAQLSLYVTIAFVAVSFVAFLLTSIRAFRVGKGEDLKDFRVQMSIVAWIWLLGELVELLVRTEPGPTLHITSMIIFSIFIVWRGKSYLI